MNPLSDLERLVAAIEKQGANIAPTYQEYMPIAFAIANDCGEAGRTFFHRICRMSEKYVSTEADKLYDHALKGGNGRNGLGSVFHLADLAGVRLDKSLAEAGKLSNFQTFTPPSHTHTCTHEEQSVKNVPPAFPPLFVDGPLVDGTASHVVGLELADEQLLVVQQPELVGVERLLDGV